MVWPVANLNLFYVIRELILAILYLTGVGRALIISGKSQQFLSMSLDDNISASLKLSSKDSDCILMILTDNEVGQMPTSMLSKQLLNDSIIIRIRTLYSLGLLSFRNLFTLCKLRLIKFKRYEKTWCFCTKSSKILWLWLLHHCTLDSLRLDVSTLVQLSVELFLMMLFQWLPS